jgi:hypothetical protein
MVKYRILLFIIGIYCICNAVGMDKSLFVEIETVLSNQCNVFPLMNENFNRREQQGYKQEYNIEKLNNEDIAFFLFYFNLYAKRNNKNMISFDDYNCEKGKELLKKLSPFSSITWGALIRREFLNKVCLFISSYNYFLLSQYSGNFPKNEQEDKVLLNARIDMEFLRIIMGVSRVESASEKAKMSGESGEYENDNNKLKKNNSEEWKEILGEKVFDEIMMHSDQVKNDFQKIFKIKTYEEMLKQSINLLLYEKMFEQSSSFLLKESNIYNQKNIEIVFLKKPLVIENALNSESDEEEASCKGKPNINLNNLGSYKNGFYKAMDSFREEINTIINLKME